MVLIAPLGSRPPCYKKKEAKGRWKEWEKNTEMPMSGPLPTKFINGSIPL